MPRNFYLIRFDSRDAPKYQGTIKRQPSLAQNYQIGTCIYESTSGINEKAMYLVRETMRNIGSPVALFFLVRNACTDISDENHYIVERPARITPYRELNNQKHTPQ